MIEKIQTSYDRILIHNVRILDINKGELTEPVNVLTSSGVIREIGPELKPDQCDWVDGNGATLVPGLINCHAHILSPFLSEQKGALGTWTLRQIDRNLNNTLAAGVVCVRDMLSPIKIMNGVRQDIIKGKRNGPQILASGACLSCNGGYPEFITPMVFPVSRIIGQPKLNIEKPKTAVTMVRYLKKQGADHIKVGFTSYTRHFNDHKRMPTITDPVFDAICKSAHEVGLRVCVHHSWGEDLTRIMRHDIDSLEHLIFDREITDEEIEMLSRRGVTVCPTLTVTDSMARFEEKMGFLESEPAAEMFEPPALAHLKWISRTWLDFNNERYDASFGFWRANRKNYKLVENTARRLYAAGIPMVAGTDLGAVVAFPGEMHDEIKRLHHIGMTKLEAIRAATISAAHHVGLEDRLGSIELGKNADFFTCDGNPLEDLDALRRVRIVTRAGRWFKNKRDALPDFWPGHSVTFQN